MKMMILKKNFFRCLFIKLDNKIDQLLQNNQGEKLLLSICHFQHW